jgi:uncharacterized protein (TIGR00661 family)
MKGENFNISGQPPRVLVAPLEWGLGHATRCIPIIRELLANGCEVLIGAESAPKELLQKEFPQLIFLSLRGYRMRYSRRSKWLPVRILLQVPKILYSIHNEHHWLKKIVKQVSINAVISDNRFGLYHNGIPCIYITHQLTIKTGNRFTEWLAQKIHYRYINRYKQCWVPDVEGKTNLAGELSHPQILPKTPVTYIGPLSRFEKMEAGKKHDLAVIISGPEPQRSIFEELLVEKLVNYRGRVLFVRGLPSGPSLKKNNNPNIEFHNHLSSAELNNAIQASAFIISRSGYTTVMDLVKLQRTALLVPTPGQTEQEYLALHLSEKKFFSCIAQKDFSLDALSEAINNNFDLPVFNQDDYKLVIKKFVEGLRKTS